MPSQTAGKPPMVMGASLLGFFKFLKDQPDGGGKLERVLAVLPAASAAECRKKVIAIAEYPYPVFADFLRACDKALGAGDLTYCRRLGAYAGARDVQVLIKMAKNQPTPADVIALSGMFWKNYHLHSGEFRFEDVTPDHTVFRITGFPQMHPAHCRLLEGYFTQALQELKRQVVEPFHETRCMSQGAPDHEFVGKWRE